MRTSPTLALLALLSAPWVAVSTGGCDTSTNESVGNSDKASPEDRGAKDRAGSNAQAQGAADPKVSADATQPGERSAPAGDSSAPAKPGDPPEAKDVGLGVDAASDRDIQAGTQRMAATLNNYSGCTMKCSVDPDARQTDVDSCLLTCRNTAESAGVAPGTPEHGLTLELDACMDRCNDKENIKPTNRSTCRLNCENAFKAQQAELHRAAKGSPTTSSAR